MYYSLNSGKTLSRCMNLSIVERSSQDVLLWKQGKDPLKMESNISVEMYYSLNSGKTLSRYITL